MEKEPFKIRLRPNDEVVDQDGRVWRLIGDSEKTLIIHMDEDKNELIFLSCENTDWPHKAVLTAIEEEPMPNAIIIDISDFFDNFQPNISEERKKLLKTKTIYASEKRSEWMKQTDFTARPWITKDKRIIPFSEKDSE